MPPSDKPQTSDPGPGAPTGPIEKVSVASPAPQADAAVARTAGRTPGARRLALLTPYRDDINRFIRDYVEARGFRIPVMGSFNEEDDRRAARIDVASIRDAAIALGRAAEVDAVFVSCTSLRLVDAVAEIEAALGKPVTSSNHAMAWHCLRLAGIDDARSGFGTLFESPLRQAAA